MKKTDIKMKTTKIINIVSGPGAGKTTMAAMIFVRLKLLGYTVEYVQEYAKELVWKKQFRKLNDQFAVSEEQYNRFKAVNGNVDYIVTDGSLLHGLYYNQTNPENLSNVEKTEKYILEFFKDFDNIVIFLERGDFDYEKEGRIQTEKEAKNVDKELEMLLKEQNISFKKFKSNINQDNINNLIEFITKP